MSLFHDLARNSYDIQRRCLSIKTRTVSACSYANYRCLRSLLMLAQMSRWSTRWRDVAHYILFVQNVQCKCKINNSARSGDRYNDALTTPKPKDILIGPTCSV